MARSAPPVPASPRIDARLVVVSGKGGVGKTTVAASLAVAAAQTGKRVLLVEVEEREGIAPLFGLERLGYRERALAPNLTGLSVVPDEALVEYLYLFYGVGRIAKPLLTGRAVEFATSTAPGLRDILLIGKVKEAEARRTGGAYAYDLIVLDAPPTGRLPRFLDAPRAVVELVHSGAIQQQAQGVLDMLDDPKRTKVMLVTTPEQMPVRETIEGIEHVRKLGIALGAVIVNQLQPQPFTADERSLLATDGAAEVARRAQRAGIAMTTAQADAVASTALLASLHAETQREALETLDDEVTLPRLTLPALMTPQFGVAQIESLAALLRDQGAI